MAFWRNIKKKGKLLRPGWYRGTIIGPHKGTEEGNQNNYWVASNGKLILVSKEQLRPTYTAPRDGASTRRSCRTSWTLTTRSTMMRPVKGHQKMRQIAVILRW